MGTAFTDDQKEVIINNLKLAVRESIKGAGMKKTSVDELAAKAGISKGMFYKLYKTKELLYFEVAEDFHEDIFATVIPYVEKKEGVSDKERFVGAVTAAINKMDELKIMEFFENDIDSVMRKVPKTVLLKHFLKDDKDINKLMKQSGIKFTVSHKILSATFRSLTGVISRKEEIGEHYDKVLNIILKGIASEVIIETNS